MTLMDSERRRLAQHDRADLHDRPTRREKGAPAQRVDPRTVDPDGLDVLRRRIDAAVLEATGTGPDPEVSELVTAAVTAFVEKGEPVGAARSVAPLCRAIGERQARRGDDADDLATAFRTARTAAQRSLTNVFDSAVRHDALIALREQLVAYLRHLFGHALHGLNCTRALMDLAPAHRLDLLRDQLFCDRQRAPLATLAELCGVDADERWRPVVSRGEALDDALLKHERAIAGRDPREAVVPAGWSSAEVRELAGGRIAVGPEVTLDRMPEAVRIARAAASVDPEQTDDVEVEDVLAPLVVSVSPLLSELLVRRHLGDLAAMPAFRRVPLAEVLLHWLQTGQPVNSVARTLGLPTQTAHSRMSTARRMFGDVLDDADGRLELLIALRTALPAWRGEAA